MMVIVRAMQFIVHAHLLFREHPLMCIYGIKFTGGFSNWLYDNSDTEVSKQFSANRKRIALQLDEAGRDLCESIWDQNETNDPYREIVIQVSNSLMHCITN